MPRRPILWPLDRTRRTVWGPLAWLAAIPLSLQIAYGQPAGPAASLQADLVSAGFDRVAVVVDSGRWVVAYENEPYRDEARAARAVAALLDAHRAPTDEGVLVLLHDAVPLVEVPVPPRVPTAARRPRASFDTADAWEPLRGVQVRGRPGIRLDLAVGPTVRAAFGQFSNPVRLRLDVAPVLSVRLRPGLRAAAQFLVPLWNEIDPTGAVVQPGFLTVHQTARLAPRTVAAVGVGQFRQERAGVDAEVIHHLPGARWRLGARVGHTWASAPGLDRPPAGPPGPRLTAQGHLARRWDGLDLWVSATAGRFLYGDDGLRLEARRSFGEVDIGFYAVRSGGESNGGFSVALPIPRPQAPQRGPLRFRPAPYADWAYRYRGAGQVGTEVDTGRDLVDLLRRVHPDRLRRAIGLRQAIGAE